MRIETTTVHCPTCNQPGQLVLFQHIDQDGNPARQALEFDCPQRHALTEGELITMWAATHASTTGAR